MVSCGLVAHRFGSYAAALSFLLLRQIQLNRDKCNAVVSDWALCAAGRLRLVSWSWTVHSFCPSVHLTVETLITSRLFSTMTVEGRRIHISLWTFFESHLYVLLH